MNSLAEEMQSKEKEYLVYKVNAGKKQENIKFPKKYKLDTFEINYALSSFDINILAIDKLIV